MVVDNTKRDGVCIIWLHLATSNGLEATIVCPNNPLFKLLRLKRTFPNCYNRIRGIELRNTLVWRCLMKIRWGNTGISLA